MSHNDEVAMKCAACGKSGDGLKKCTACKLVRYCNVSCQKTHRPQHKQACKKQSAILRDEALFKEPPPREECAVCFLPLPWSAEGVNYNPCCGKEICSGCVYGVFLSNDRYIICPFCRAPAPSSPRESIERIRKRVEVGDAAAMHQLGSAYHGGNLGVRQDRGKSMELWLRSGELGYPEAYYSIAVAYARGEVGAEDHKKANHYFELAAMGGDAMARHNLGVYEMNQLLQLPRRVNRAVRHFKIAARAGNEGSLAEIRRCFQRGYVSKAEYEEALRGYQETTNEAKSEQREAAKKDAYFQSRTC